MTGREEPEVKAVMNLAYSLPITGAASLHEGALVANYPWDGDKGHKKGYAATPDDATFQYLAKSYAQKHTRMGEQAPWEGEQPRVCFVWDIDLQIELVLAHKHHTGSRYCSVRSRSLVLRGTYFQGARYLANTSHGSMFRLTQYF